jgi:hypothetical protein
MKRYPLFVSVLALACGMAGPVVAETGQSTPAEAKVVQEPGPKQAPATVRVQIVLSRYQGEKKIASIPYALLVATDGQKVSLRMGVEVPIAVGGPSFQYRNVGTNIDVRAGAPSGRLYPIQIQLENSSVHRKADDRAPAQDPVGVEERPMFRTFSVQLSLVLEDGQTVQSVASTDPVTGEVVKIDVTLSVVK